jgi:phenylalanyl-tRNA synthetase alpha chain
MVTYEMFSPKSHVLTPEGLSIAEGGSHEFLVWNACPSSSEEPATAKAIEAAVGKEVAKIGQGKAMRNKWISKKGDGFVKAVSRRTSARGESRS